MEHLPPMQSVRYWFRHCGTPSTNAVGALQPWKPDRRFPGDICEAVIEQVQEDDFGHEISDQFFTTPWVENKSRLVARRTPGDVELTQIDMIVDGFRVS